MILRSRVTIPYFAARLEVEGVFRNLRGKCPRSITVNCYPFLLHLYLSHLRREMHRCERVGG